MAAAEMRQVAHDARLALVLGPGVGFGNVNPAGYIDMAARRIVAQLLRRFGEQRAIVRALPRKLGDRRPTGEKQPEPKAGGDADRAIGGAGKENRRMRLLQRLRKDLVLAADLDAKAFAVMLGALKVQQVEQERQRLLLDVAPRFEVDTEAIEFVFAVAGAEAKREPAVAQDIDEGGVFGDPQRIGERQRHHRGADLDAFRQRREVAGVNENVRHDAVFVAEVMFGEPGIIVAEFVGAHDLRRHPRVYVTVRIRLGLGVGMRGEQNAEFHWPIIATALRQGHGGLDTKHRRFGASEVAESPVRRSRSDTYTNKVEVAMSASGGYC